jgi:hypothetical protein
MVTDPIPADFVTDGCSSLGQVVERLLRWLDYEIEPFCKRHDWRYCTRCQPPGSMTYAAKIRADHELADGMASILPRALDWTAGAVYRGVVIGGPFNAWDSCGPEAGERCRHGQLAPQWMLSASATAGPAGSPSASS